METTNHLIRPFFPFFIRIAQGKMVVFSVQSSLILTLLIVHSVCAIPEPGIPAPSNSSDNTDLPYPSRARRACCSYYSYPSLKCGTIPCGGCCYRTPPPAFPTPLVIPPLPFFIRPPLPPSPTAISGCSVCG